MKTIALQDCLQEIFIAKKIAKFFSILFKPIILPSVNLICKCKHGEESTKVQSFRKS